MKGVVATALTVALIATTSVEGMQSFLAKLPNGSKFAKALGHSGDSGYTPFGSAFLDAGTTWSTEFCKATFPGSKLTNGQAFGDPCCTWKSGAAPQSVSAFTTDPGTGTTCATDAKPAAAPAPAGGNTKPAPAPAGGNSKPAPAPAGGNSKPAPAPAGGNSKPAPAPAGNNKPAPAPAGGNKKPACKKKMRSL